ncbi:MAG: insulinase family protein [Deltaproteobacteria bacterium]|nr:insulinase family protein [Deltaproteobacteria bacterium]
MKSTSNSVTPAKAGVQNLLKSFTGMELDSGSLLTACRDKLRGNDKSGVFKVSLKRIFLILGLLLLSFSVQAGNWQPPKVSVYRLSNGFQLYFLEDHTLPIVEAQLLVKTGDVVNPPKLAGLSDILASLLVTGGTEAKKPSEVDAWLDQRAIHLSAESGREIVTLKISALSKVWKESLNFLGEVMLHPAWDPGRFTLAVNRYKEGLRRDEDEPETIAMRAFRQAIYGSESSLSRVPTATSLDKITIKDIQQMFKKYFQPDRMILAVAGDFSSTQVKAWAEKTFGPIKSIAVENFVWKEIPFQNKPVLKKIKKKLTQAFIETGHLSLKRFDKEEYTYGLLQYILGGDPFTSRLGVDIRTDRGLAYSVYSDWDTNPSRGLFHIHVETKRETQDLVLDRIKTHLVELAEKGNITPEELKKAKDAMLNRYIFWFDSPFKVVMQKARLDILGFPSDYLEKYPDKVKKVTLEEVNAIAKKWLQPNNLATVLVGP